MKQIYLFLLFCLFSQLLSAQCIGTKGEATWWLYEDVALITYETEDVYRMNDFPNGPDYVRNINSLNSPVNYNDNYASLMKGFIEPTGSGQVVFNVEIPQWDVYDFYVSTNQSAANLVKVNADAANGNLDYLNFTAGQKYYFELVYREGGGGDFSNITWKADFLPGGINAAEWSTVTSDYIYATCDTPCPPKGTACNDGNASTQNDQEDGNCKCTGTPTPPDNCVGERGKVRAFRYDNLGGNHQLTTLNAAIANGTKASNVMDLENYVWKFYNNNGGSDFGMYVQAYIKVPETGQYQFNLTASDECIAYISSNHSPANKTATTLKTNWWSGAYGHNAWQDNNWNPGQTSATLTLNANQYYYVEIRSRMEEEYEFFNLFWKTPGNLNKDWKRVPTFHLYDYTCGTTCVQAGVACNDNDPYTKNDRWNNNCNCAGTPCQAPDCDDPTTSYIRPEECETTNLLDNRADDTWLSCDASGVAPNPVHNGHHWIEYDFGKLYNLGTTHIWNYNAYNATNQGFQNVTIDYSTDGINWENLGTYNWALADNSADYAGFVGPDFTGVTAQYVLIVSNDSGGTGCRGLSKVAFNALSCPVMQWSTPTADQNLTDPVDIPVSLNVTPGEAAITKIDLYLDGSWIATDNSAPYSWSNVGSLQNLLTGDYKLSAVATDANGTQCELSTVIHVTSANGATCHTGPLNLPTSPEPVYRTQQTITSTSTITGNQTKTYIAAQSIDLMPGFTVQAGSYFSARIGNCSTSALNDVAQSRVTPLTTTTTGEHDIKVYPNPVVDKFTVQIDAYQAGTLDLSIYDVLGKELTNFTQKRLVEKGLVTFDLSAASLTAGMYFCKIKIGDETFTESFVRVDKN